MNATQTKQFHIGDILTITDGHLVSPSHVAGVYDLLGWLTGEEGLMTHQLPRVGRECEGPLRAMFPDLAEIKVPSGMDSEQKVLDYLDGLREQYGTHRDVPRLPDPLDHTSIDPIQEIKMMRPDLPVIVIGGDGDE